MSPNRESVISFLFISGCTQFEDPRHRNRVCDLWRFASRHLERSGILKGHIFWSRPEKFQIFCAISSIPCCDVSLFMRVHFSFISLGHFFWEPLGIRLSQIRSIAGSQNCSLDSYLVPREDQRVWNVLVVLGKAAIAHNYFFFKTANKPSFSFNIYVHIYTQTRTIYSRKF